MEQNQNNATYVCPVCKRPMSVGLGGYYKHITPGRCGYYAPATQKDLVSAVKNAQSEQ